MSRVGQRSPDIRDSRIRPAQLLRDLLDSQVIPDGDLDLRASPLAPALSSLAGSRHAIRSIDSRPVRPRSR